MRGVCCGNERVCCGNERVCCGNERVWLLRSQPS